jgi:hypothetical protein
MWFKGHKMIYHYQILHQNIFPKFISGEKSRQLLRKFSPATANGRSQSETRPPQDFDRL